MSRACFLAVLLALIGSAIAQGVAAPAGAPVRQPAPPPLLAADVARMLEKRIDWEGVEQHPEATVGLALAQFGKVHDLAFRVDHRAFQSANKEGRYDLLTQKIADDRAIPAARGIKLKRALQDVLDAVPSVSPALYLIRPGYIEITTEERVRERLRLPEGRPLMPLVWASFDGVPLTRVFGRLVEDTGYSALLDARLREKLEKTPALADLTNVPVDTAVRLLADMHGLGVALVDNVFYITEPENAARLETRRPMPAKGK